MPNPPVVVRFENIQEAFEKNPDGVLQAVHDGARDFAGGDAEQATAMVAAWNNAMAELKKEDKGTPVMSSARDAVASRLQTHLAEYAAEQGKVNQVQPPTAVSTPDGDSEAAEIVEVKFSDDDLIGWIGMSWKLIFKPETHPWIDPPAEPETLADDAVISLFGDWATGLYGAPVTSRSIAKMSRCDVVIHLGDTYYSGGEDETENRLVGDWPNRTDSVKRSLNGNHEMYSGGHGYFAALQNFFHQQASCFAMQNQNWLLVGLDTAYVDYDLDDRQVDWLNSIIAAAGTRKVILFSHHQPFSQLDTQGPKLQQKLHDVLNKQRVYAWFWGHEHRLVLYDAHSQWGFKGRCVGHGGYPAFRDKLPGTGGNIYQWLRLTPQPHVPAARLLDGPNFWVVQDPLGYSPHGYGVLEFADEHCFETYRTPNGISVTERMQL